MSIVTWWEILKLLLDFLDLNKKARTDFLDFNKIAMLFKMHACKNFPTYVAISACEHHMVYLVLLFV